MRATPIIAGKLYEVRGFALTLPIFAPSAVDAILMVYKAKVAQGALCLQKV